MPGGGSMEIRRAAVAGSWYPGAREELASELDRLLADATNVDVRGRVVGLVAPHAGLLYSGGVAAHAYRLLQGRRELTAVLVGPSHRVAFDGAAVVARGGFETPLGVAPIDEGLAGALMRAAAPGVIVDLPGPHRSEHSLEMQLPFLQRVVSGLRIVPVLLGSQVREECASVAEALTRAVGGRDDVVLVASSDLSHYHPAPVANALDRKVVARVAALDADGLMDLLETERGHACGGGPMVAVMQAARSLGARHGTILRYADSGDAGEHDKSRVVGYLAAALAS